MNAVIPNVMSTTAKFGSPDERIRAKLYEKVQEMQKAKLLPPPDVLEKMTAIEMEIFDEIIVEAPIVEWTPMRIRIAANWARCEYQYNIYFDKFVDEGGVTGDFDDKIRGEVKIMQMLQTQIMKYKRTLNMATASIYAGMPNAGTSARRDKLGRLIEEAEQSYGPGEAKENPNDIRMLIAVNR